MCENQFMSFLTGSVYAKLRSDLGETEGRTAHTVLSAVARSKFFLM